MKATQRSRSFPAKLLAAALAVVAMCVVTSTGFARSDASSATIGGYTYIGTPAQTAAARTAGLKAAGPTVQAPKGKTIAVIQLSGTSAQSIGVLATARRIGRMFGYKVVVCDPNFDPQKVAQCATSTVAQNPGVIFSVSTNTGSMGSGFRDAVSRKIPWFSVVSGVVPARGLYDYGDPGFELTKIVDKYLIQQMAARNQGKKATLFAIGAPTVGIASKNEGVQLARDVKAAGNVELINHDLDLSNAVQDTLSTTQQALQQHPDLGGVWTLCDFCLPLMAQVVGKAQGANRHTVVAGLYANPQAVDGIRKGTIDAVSDLPWMTAVWVGMDQALQNWVRGKAIAKSGVYRKYTLPFWKPYLITKANVGTKRGISVFGADYETYFTTKWKKEFGLK
jgi:ABC-type sugar transport system substrate-binding protein